MGGCMSVEVEGKDKPQQKAPSAAAAPAKKDKPAAEPLKTPASAATNGKPAETSSGPDAADGENGTPARRFKLKEFAACTNNWDEENVLGEGSFGKVYKGMLDETQPNGEVKQLKLAIKKLNPESFQGYEEWLAEVLLLDKLRHPCLVRLIGYCAEKGEALLAYELCPHGSLDQALFEPEGHLLSWEERVKIALDAAQGLAYLHESNIIHRDFKASNILLSEDYGGRITDFGMARAGPEGGQSHISTRVMGTLGYLDPTYMETGRLTRKSDVYAFGVLLLELLTGKRTMGEDGSESLTQWIKPFLSQRKPDLKLLVDPRLGEDYSRAGAVKMAILAKHCIHDDPGYRPEMTTLAENLKLVDLKDPEPVALPEPKPEGD